MASASTRVFERLRTMSWACSLSSFHSNSSLNNWVAVEHARNLAASSERCARCEALNSAGFAAVHPSLRAKQHRDFCSLYPVVRVSLIKNEMFHGRSLAVEEGAVGWAKQQVLQHGVVGEQDRRRGGLHFFSGEEFVGGSRFMGIAGCEV